MIAQAVRFQQVDGGDGSSAQRPLGRLIAGCCAACGEAAIAQRSLSGLLQSVFLGLCKGGSTCCPCPGGWVNAERGRGTARRDGWPGPPVDRRQLREVNSYCPAEVGVQKLLPVDHQQEEAQHKRVVHRDRAVDLRRRFSGRATAWGPGSDCLSGARWAGQR
eukprot:360189-Chlamydomonas_euryale.AAC.5